VGKVEVSRPYYLCSHCQAGQFPADAELDIENADFSPGVRRMQAMVGQDAPFDHGRQQMKLLADLEVTTKLWSARRRRLGQTSPHESKTKSTGPRSWIYPLRLESRSHSCMCNWTARECP
jgi:hypothetical protein